MGVFNFGKRKVEVNLAEVVQEMFDKDGIKPARQEGIFFTVIDGTNASYKTVLRCDGNQLTVYVLFVIPVPKDMAYSVQCEVNRLNLECKDAQIIFYGKGETYELAAFSQRTFESAPTTDEIKTLMIHHVDAMDAERFRSLACAILGYATFEEVTQNMAMTDLNEEEGHVGLKLAGGYASLLKESGDISAPRFAGRLLMFATLIIGTHCSQKRPFELLTTQTPFDDIVQEAYNHADEKDRDLIRKLRYLAKVKPTTTDNDDEFMQGRIEAMPMLALDKYLLLRGNQ